MRSAGSTCRSMQQPSSILHVGKFYPPHPGGMETHLRSLVAYQSRQARVEVLVSNHESRTVTESLDGARITRLATYGSIASMPLTPGFLKHLRGRVDDIVHLHMPNPAAAAAFLASGHPGKLILTHHGDTLGRPALRRVSDPFVRRAMKRAEAIIVSSERYLDSSEELRSFRAKCQYIPLGIDLSHEAPVDPAEVAAIRAQHGEKLVLAIGRLVPYKGFAYLIRALRHTPATLLLIGKGPLLAELQQVARDAGVAERTHFLGYVDDPTPYYHAARIFALSSVSRAESFGLVQLEAMAAGLPVINTDLLSSVPEISLHGVTGLTVPPADDAAMGGAIQLLLDNETRRLAYSKAARERVLTFSAASTAEKTLAIYMQALERVPSAEIL